LITEKPNLKKKTQPTNNNNNNNNNNKTIQSISFSIIEIFNDNQN